MRCDAGTTNEDRPFEQGEVIEFCGDWFVVNKNHGNSGEVTEYDGGATISPFYWTFEGEPCRRVDVNRGTC